MFKTTPIRASAGFSVDYSAISRSPPNKWTTEQRITLRTLLQCYEATGLETMLIFNSLFAEELPTSKGLSKAALMTMHHKPQQDNFSHSGSWITIRKTLEAEATKLNIHLTPKEPFNETASSKVMEKGNSLNITPGPDPPSNGRALDSIDWPSDSDDTLLGDDDNAPETPSADRPLLEKALKIPGLMNAGSSTSHVDEEVSRSKSVPKLAYRA